MDKLVTAFLAAPTAANRAKLEAHSRKHMMAACMLTAEQVAALAVHGVIL